MADDGKAKKTCCQSFGEGLSNFGKFLYNNETGQVMGRSGESWAKIGLFYVIFYGFLAAFFTAMLTVFLSTLNDVGQGPPKLIQYLENQPGLTRLSLDLKYNKSETRDKDIKAYKDAVSKFLETYDSEDNGKEMCKGPGAMEAPCKFDYVKHLGPCAKPGNNSYGLEDLNPCIYVKINKIYGWIPKGKDGYLNLKCKEEVNMYPKDGFLIAGFPFKGQGATFNLPVVAIQLNVTQPGKSVDCFLDGPDIVISESYVAHRAYGVIRIS